MLCLFVVSIDLKRTVSSVLTGMRHFLSWQMTVMSPWCLPCLRHPSAVLLSSPAVTVLDSQGWIEEMVSLLSPSPLTGDDACEFSIFLIKSVQGIYAVKRSQCRNRSMVITHRYDIWFPIRKGKETHPIWKLSITILTTKEFSFLQSGKIFMYLIK